MDSDDVLRRARLLAGLGRVGEAADLLRAAVAEDPDNAELLTAWAELALEVDDLGSALEAATAAIQADPDAAGAATGVLARVYLAGGQPGQAVELARRRVEHDPQDPAAHALLATCLAEQAPLGSARRAAFAAIDRVLELAPGDADLLLEAAQAAAALDSSETVRTAVAAGLRADPAHPGLQAMHARYRELTGDKVAALTSVLAADPTHRYARHALADVMWGTIARLASGVWVYALAVTLCSMFVPPAVLRHLLAVLAAPLTIHWIRVFSRLRKRLPRGYLRRRLWRSPPAAAGVLLAGVAAVLATFTPLPIVIGWSADGVRLGYAALIFACLPAGLAHLLITLGRVRRGGDVHLGTHLAEHEGNWAVWLFGLLIPIAICAAGYRWARQPGALWFALMLVPIVLGVLAVEANVKHWLGRRTWHQPLAATVAALLFVAACGWTVLWCAHRAAATEFHYVVGPLSPERMPRYTHTPYVPPPLPSRVPHDVPRGPAG